MGARLLRGRSFDRRDHRDAGKVVIVSETMAARYWPNADPLGQSIQLDEEAWQIVGVVEDGKIISIHEPPQPYLYLPFEQAPSQSGTLIVEAAGDTAALTSQIRRRLSSSGIRLRIIGVMTLDQHMENALYASRMPAQVATGIALLGVLLAAVGLYGVVSYAVSRQTREFGIRLALGAERGQILRLTLNRGLRLALAGAAIGVTLAVAISYWFASLFPGFIPGRIWPFAGSVVFVVAVALVSTWLPARRASRVEASVALRYE
ncbi:MAG: FtsX-like permease family protein [bacterium]|nr:FtsX-like permease family protein [bacterium]